MAAYNGESYLPAQLDSIRRQTRPPDELVICDDRSSDRTRNIIDAFAAAAPFPVRLHGNEANLGIARNFEQAIGLCSGDVVCLSDQDDLWYPNKLARIEKLFSIAPSAGLMFSDADLKDENLRPMGWTLHQSFGCAQPSNVLLDSGAEAVGVLLGKRFGIYGNTMAFRARFKHLVLPMPDKIRAPYLKGFHDVWIAVLIASVADVAILGEPLLAYRQHGGQHGGSPLPDPLRQRLERLFRAPDLPAEISRLLCTRMAAVNGRADGIAIANAWSWHLSVRAGLPRRRLSRVPRILRELITARYHRFSNGVPTAVKDLLVVRT
ncbi:MAG: glycosyltransferase family 2 protein [Candidatus Binataceae bacterium]